MCILTLATGLMIYASGDAFQFFRSPSEVASAPPPSHETFRLGGLVEDGSLERGVGEEIRFRVTDGAQSVAVTFTGILPDLFREGQGMIASGTLQGGVFVADEVLAKHDEDYLPREVADALKEQGVFKGGGS